MPQVSPPQGAARCTRRGKNEARALPAPSREGGGSDHAHQIGLGEARSCCAGSVARRQARLDRRPAQFRPMACLWRGSAILSPRGKARRRPRHHARDGQSGSGSSAASARRPERCSAERSRSRPQSSFSLKTGGRFHRSSFSTSHFWLRHNQDDLGTDSWRPVSEACLRSRGPRAARRRQAQRVALPQARMRQQGRDPNPLQLATAWIDLRVRDKSGAASGNLPTARRQCAETCAEAAPQKAAGPLGPMPCPALPNLPKRADGISAGPPMGAAPHSAVARGCTTAPPPASRAAGVGVAPTHQRPSARTVEVTVSAAKARASHPQSTPGLELCRELQRAEALGRKQGLPIPRGRRPANLDQACAAGARSARGGLAACSDGASCPLQAPGIPGYAQTAGRGTAQAASPSTGGGRRAPRQALGDTALGSARPAGTTTAAGVAAVASSDTLAPC